MKQFLRDLVLWAIVLIGFVLILHPKQPTYTLTNLPPTMGTKTLTDFEVLKVFLWVNNELQVREYTNIRAGNNWWYADHYDQARGDDLYPRVLTNKQVVAFSSHDIWLYTNGTHLPWAHSNHVGDNLWPKWEHLGEWTSPEAITIPK